MIGDWFRNIIRIDVYGIFYLTIRFRQDTGYQQDEANNLIYGMLFEQAVRRKFVDR